MPSSATITSFNTFVAGTRARASQVNANFDVFRGHLIPMNSDTATASDNAHDLGSSEHRWRRAYFVEPPVIGSSSGPKYHVQAVVDGSLPTHHLGGIPPGLNRISFPADAETGIKFQFSVPDDYVSGNRMSLALRGYCETAPAHITLESGSELYRMSLTAMGLTAPTNVLTTTSNINPTASGLAFVDTSLHLTDANGLINGVTVQAGDVVACYLKRKGAATADTNTGYYHLAAIVVDLNT